MEISLLTVQDELISHADLSCSIFWSSIPIEDENLPGSIKGKLGGPSQRRLSSSATTSVLQAVWFLALFRLYFSFFYQLQLLQSIK